jgi:hypothetical protein
MQILGQDSAQINIVAIRCVADIALFRVFNSLQVAQKNSNRCVGGVQVDF